jgi:uncharacterized SAM-binding protein YcdF (DUF218 family)
MPLAIGLILGIIGLFFLYRNSIKKAKLFLTLSLIWIALVGYQPFSNTLLKNLEDRYPQLTNIPTNTTYLLILGGNKQGRTYEALKLYQKNKDLKIVTSGPLRSDGKIEAEVEAEFLIELGIPKKSIIMQKEPRDTREEAIYMKQKVGNKPFILVTSAYHMPRAMAIFKAQGLNPIAAPANIMSSKNGYLSIPNGAKLFESQIAFHEYLGLLWYKLRGYI